MKVTSGSVDVFDSSIDNASGDPVVTPIALLPTEIASSATIGPAGGAVRSADGILTLKVPAGALSAPTAISIATTSEPGLPLMSESTYLILPDGLSFSREALLVQSYTAQDLIGTSADALSLVISDGSSWYVMTGSSLDVSRRTLTVPLDRLGPPALVRQAQAKAGDPGTPVKRMFMYGIDPQYGGPVVEGSKAPIDFTFYRCLTGPSTSKKKGSPAQKVGTVSSSLASWSEDGKFMEDGVKHTYHVPACAPKKVVDISATPITHGAVFTASVYVYPRTWIVQIQQYAEITECSGSDLFSRLPLPIFHSETYLTRTFTLGDDLTFKVSSDVNTGTVTQTGPTLCPYQGHDCHYTAVAMSKIVNAGEIISVTKGPSTFASSLYVRVFYDDLEFPSIEWSASNCRPPEASHKFPGLPGFPAFQEWPLYPDGFRFKEPAKSEFVSPDGMVSTRSFWVKIDPYPSPSCQR